MPRRKAGACETCVSTVVPIVLLLRVNLSASSKKSVCGGGAGGSGACAVGVGLGVCAPSHHTCVNVCVSQLSHVCACGCVHAGGRGERRKQKVRQTLGIGMG